MTGNLEDATRALARDLPVLSYVGSSRTVYINDNDKVVYKVENGLEDIGVNAIEYKAMTTVELSPGVFFPSVTLYNVDGNDIIAMDYIEGQIMAECYCIADSEECTADCMTDEVWQLVNGTLDDPSGFNTIVSRDGIFIIDMG